jgi:hypothetical protein
MPDLQKIGQPKRGRPAVRPSVRDPDAVRAIFEGMAAGEAVSRICMDPTMPSRTDIYAELERNRDFRARFSRARIVGLHTLGDEMLELADNARDEDVARVALQLKARRWYFARIEGRKYGRLDDPYVVGGNPIDELIKAFKQPLGTKLQASPTD